MLIFTQTVNSYNNFKNPSPTKTLGHRIFSQEVKRPSGLKYSATVIGFNINHIPDFLILRAHKREERQNSETQ